MENIHSSVVACVNLLYFRVSQNWFTDVLQPITKQLFCSQVNDRICLCQLPDQIPSHAAPYKCLKLSQPNIEVCMTVSEVFPTWCSQRFAKRHVIILISVSATAAFTLLPQRTRCCRIGSICRVLSVVFQAIQCFGMRAVLVTSNCTKKRSAESCHRASSFSGFMEVD
jgi:hypothetical protein